MNFYTLNLQRSMESFESFGIVTCPIKDHPGLNTMAKMQRGDIVLILDGPNIIKHIACVFSDTYSRNISYYRSTPMITSDPMLTVQLDMMVQNINADWYIIGGLINPKKYHEMNLCNLLTVKEGNATKFKNDINSLLKGNTCEAITLDPVLNYLDKKMLNNEEF